MFQSSVTMLLDEIRESNFPNRSRIWISTTIINNSLFCCKLNSLLNIFIHSSPIPLFRFNSYSCFNYRPVFPTKLLHFPLKSRTYGEGKKWFAAAIKIEYWIIHGRMSFRALLKNHTTTRALHTQSTSCIYTHDFGIFSAEIFINFNQLKQIFGSNSHFVANKNSIRSRPSFQDWPIHLLLSNITTELEKSSPECRKICQMNILFLLPCRCWESSLSDETFPSQKPFVKLTIQRK